MYMYTDNIHNIIANASISLSPACSMGCPTGQFESNPCTTFADRKCTGKYETSYHSRIFI